MQDLQRVFDYGGRQVRTVLVNGEPHFVAKDVCDILTLTNPTEAIRGLDDDEKTTLRISEGGPEANIVTEAGLYSLVIRSNKPEAKQFKRWVTHEVLPTIRKTGQYSVAIPATFAEALRLAADQAEQIEQQTKLLEAAKPKVEFYDQVAGSKDAISIRDAAKVLNVPGVGQNKLFAILRDKRVLMSDNRPYQEYVDRGYFRMIEQKYNQSGEAHIAFKTLVYQKGLDYIRRLLTA